MKRLILLTTACLMLLSSFAQKADKKLLLGHWKCHYFSMSDFTLNADNMKQSVEQRVKAVTALAKDHILSSKDSFELVEKTYYQCRQIDSSYIEFKKDGRVKLQLYLPIDGDNTDLKQGTYSWTGDNQLIIYLGEDKTTFSIYKLTSNILEVVTNEERDAGERITIKFRR